MATARQGLTSRAAAARRRRPRVGFPPKQCHEWVRAGRAKCLTSRATPPSRAPPVEPRPRVSGGRLLRAQHAQLAVEVFLVQIRSTQSPEALIGPPPMERPPVVEQHAVPAPVSCAYLIRWIVDQIRRIAERPVNAFIRGRRQAERSPVVVVVGDLRKFRCDRGRSPGAPPSDAPRPPGTAPELDVGQHLKASGSLRRM